MKWIIIFGTWCFMFSSAAASDSRPGNPDAEVEALMNRFKYREAVTVILNRLKLADNKDVNSKLYFFNKLSLASLRLRNIDSALAMARVSLSLIPKTTDSTLIAEAWKVTAYAFNNVGKLDSALIYTRMMLGYAERHGEERQTRNAIVSIATIMAQNKQFQEALRYYRRASDLTFRIKDTANYPVSEYNLGLTHLNLKNTDSCLFYLNKAMETARNHNHPDVLIYIYGTMADCYLILKNDRERKKYLLQANEVAEKLGNRQFLAMGYSNLTTGALMEKNYREALSFAGKALTLLKVQPYPVLKMKMDSMMWVAYRELGQYKEALASLEAYMAGKDMLVSEHQKEQLNQLDISLKVKEKDLTITTQQLEITGKKRKIEVLTLIIILIIVLAAGQSFFVIKTRAFRKELFRKEKELDKYSEDVRMWLQWKNMQSEAVLQPNDEPDKDMSNDEEDTEKIQQGLFIELRDIFDKQKLYLDPELNLKTVIRLLGTNKKYLHQAISENTDNNFRSFINRYRIDEAKRIMGMKVAANEEVNLSELYISAGFNSPVSFYRAFRSVTGLIPRDYLKEIIAQVRN